ncbi:MAG: FkbM family methyltransferase [Pirellulales bacterium]
MSSSFDLLVQLAEARLESLARRLRPVRTAHPLVRIGGPHDGGYLVPDDLVGIAACFSPGVGDSARFEADLQGRAGIPSHLADGSVSGPPAEFRPASFTRRYLGVVDDDDDPSVMTIDSWVRSRPDLPPGDLMLQMDIEGAEYAVLLGASPELLARFRIIVLEVHGVEAWSQHYSTGIAEALFDRLLHRFHVVHLHANNCCGLIGIGGFIAPRVFELTLLRKDRGPALGYAEEFPHPLDAANVPGIEDLTLPAQWRFRPSPVEAITSLPAAYLARVDGVLHVGAHTGQERWLYDRYGLAVVWVEPIPEVCDELRRNLREFPLQRAYRRLLTDRDGASYDLRLAGDDGLSSSLFDRAESRPNAVAYVSWMSVRSSTLATLSREEGIDLSRYQALVLDVQGAELAVLHGAGEMLDRFRYIQVDGSDFEDYAGGCRLDEVKRFLAARGFIEAEWTGGGPQANPEASPHVLFMQTG